MTSQSNKCETTNQLFGLMWWQAMMMEYHNYINMSVEAFVENFATNDDLVHATSDFNPSLPHNQTMSEQRKHHGSFCLYSEDKVIIHIDAHTNTDCRCIIEYPAGDLSQLRVECRNCHDLGSAMWNDPMSLGE